MTSRPQSNVDGPAGESTNNSSDPPHSSGQSGGVPPGPDGLPIVGNTHSIIREPFAFLDELHGYGDVVRYRILGNTVTALFHPDYVQRVLVEEPETFERYLFADQGFDFAPEGILFTQGEQWRTQRQLMQPAFTVDRIRSYTDTMARYAEQTADSWETGDEIVLNRAFSRLTLRILTNALFDLDLEPGESDAVTRAAQLINEQSNSRSVAGFLPEWVPTPGNRRYHRTLEAYRDRVDTLIEERRADAAGTEEPGDDLLSVLVHHAESNGGALTEREIQDNLITFTFAGHETTSLVLTYAFYLLTQHDDVRRRLEAEQQAVLGGATPTFEDVTRLEVTDRVLQETMRLYPPAYIIFRKPTRDVTIGGYDVPEGTVLSLPQYRIHRDERFYDEPEAFRPDRWREECVNDRPEYAYFPFGGGARHCIGMRFAMLELKVVLTTLLQRFDLELVSDPDLALSPGATLQPADDVHVRLTERT
ncbi:cytochrome P450 [Natronosalvus vescus]|uniref:cytochrome P450 n=1 Tax=Natronosalvus vescus TaxID=2953881 RepID=UPI0020910AF2|nr:cytochrome P450 [Natronosalvus vescus]